MDLGRALGLLVGVIVLIVLIFLVFKLVGAV
jgi:hypothetical protein